MKKPRKIQYWVIYFDNVDRRHKTVGFVNARLAQASYSALNKNSRFRAIAITVDRDLLGEQLGEEYDKAQQRQRKEAAKPSSYMQGLAKAINLLLGDNEVTKKPKKESKELPIVRYCANCGAPVTTSKCHECGEES